jgi:hypothetical protein
MKRFAVLLFVNAIVALQVVGQPHDAQFNAVVGRSTFIFLGTIIYMDSSDIKANFDRPKAIVTVDYVIDGSQSDSSLQGSYVTVVFSSSVVHHNGDQLAFFTYGWSYGNSVGVIEIKNNITKMPTSTLIQKVKIARQQIADDSLKAELKRSVIVAKCYVTSIDSIYISIFPRSEHNPLFQKAHFHISELLKGHPKKDTLSAYFASSYDPIWFYSPKVADSTEAIFLFHKSAFPPFVSLSGLVLLDPRDVQPNSELNRIKKLLK